MVLGFMPEHIQSVEPMEAHGEFVPRFLGL